MSEAKNRKALTSLPTDYEVGYGKPPAATRFAPGRSGNPKGRPKGSKSRPKPPALNEERMKSILMQEAYRTIKVNEGAGQVSIPMAQAVIRSLAVNAVKGNQRAQRLFTQLLSTTERENKRLADEWLNTAITYKVEWDQELERRKRLGIDAPAPIPHPDDIVINMNTGMVSVRGPMTKEDKVKWDELRGRKREFETELAELQQMLIDDPDRSYRYIIEDDIAHTRKMIAIIGRVIID